MFDKGIVPTVEPFKKLVNQGMIQGVICKIYLYPYSKKEDFAFTAPRWTFDRQVWSSKIKDHEEYFHPDPDMGEGFLRFMEEPTTRLIPLEFCTEFTKENKTEFRLYKKIVDNLKFLNTPSASYVLNIIKGFENFNWTKDELGDEFILLDAEVGKMSKRYYNVVNPDDVVEKYGSDCFRMYEMFLGPIEHAKPWDTKGIDGVSKFLRKFWSLFFDETGNFNLSKEDPSKEELKILHTAIKKITDDIERFSFNTCVSAFMVAVNDLKKINCNNQSVLEEMVRLIAPFAPHVAEELWDKLGGLSESKTVQESQFPSANEAYLKEDSIKYPIAINGKTRAFANFPADASKDDIEKAAIEIEDVQKWTDGKTVRKVIVVPNRMINIVVG